MPAEYDSRLNDEQRVRRAREGVDGAGDHPERLETMERLKGNGLGTGPAGTPQDPGHAT